MLGASVMVSRYASVMQKFNYDSCGEACHKSLDVWSNLVKVQNSYTIEYDSLLR